MISFSIYNKNFLLFSILDSLCRLLLSRRPPQKNAVRTAHCVVAVAVAVVVAVVLTRKKRPRRMPRIAGGPQALSAVTPA